MGQDEKQKLVEQKKEIKRKVTSHEKNKCIQNNKEETQ